MYVPPERQRNEADRLQRSHSAEDALRRGVNLNRNIEALYSPNIPLSLSIYLRLTNVALCCSIENPLNHLTPDLLERDARRFARLAELDEDLVVKGARIAKDPQYIATIPGVTEDERAALHDERRHRFHQPAALYLTITVCSIGAAVQGWDQTGSNGANLNWPQAFRLNTDEKSRDFWILGLVNGFDDSGLSSRECARFDTRYSSHGLAALADLRRPRGFTANLILFQVGPIAWRLQLGSAFIPAVPLIALVYFCPESPRWYIKKHQYSNAFNSLLRLRNTPVQAARDLYYIYAQVRLEEEALGGGDIIISDGQEHFSGSGRYFSRFIQLFMIPRIRRATLAAFVVMIAQQMCGKVGMSLAVSINLFFAGVLTLVYPKLSDALTPTGTIGFFAGLNIIAFMMIFLWVPETKQRTLEELDHIFRQIIDDYINSYESLSEADIDPFRLEVHTLYTFLDLFDKVRNAREPRLDIEDSHIADITHLLHRCQRTLANLHDSLKLAWHSAAVGEGQQAPWDLNTSTFTVPRVYISFYTRTLEMSCMGIHLLHRWRGQLLPDSGDLGWEEFSRVTRALLLTINQRRDLTGGGYHEGSVDEMGLLRDVEQCVKSAEVFISTASSGMLQSNGHSIRSPTAAQAQSQPNGSSAWSMDLSLRNGSRTSSSPPNSRVEDHASDDSDVESIDPEIAHDGGFSAETYKAMIEGMMQELKHKMDCRDYGVAEVICKTITKHSIDREKRLGIPFGNRPGLDETLVEIYLEQNRYQKAKKILRQLLQHQVSMNMNRRAKLHFLFARAYYGRAQLHKAESLAQSSLKSRDSLYGQEDPLTQQSALLLIAIYEAQGDSTTANGLRKHHCPHAIPPPPPRSALRQPHQQLSSVPRSSYDIPSTNHAPPGGEDESYHSNRTRVHWAPDVVASDSSINALIDSGQTTLIYAIRRGDDAYVRLTLERGASVETPDADTITPLMHAVMVESKSIVEILLEHKADVEARVSGWTPLQKATDMSSLAIMQLLLDAGAYIEATSPFEFIPPRSEDARKRAIARDEPDLEGEVLCQKNLKWTPLLRAAFNGDMAAAPLLISNSANIEARNPTKATPLILACENLHLSTATLLLSRGANVGAADEYGLTPLHRCCFNRSPSQTQILALLLERSADINAKCNHGCTSLHYAVKNKLPEIVTFLVDHKADIEARDSANLTPLHTAIDARSEPMVRLLLGHGADASAMTGVGEDALAAAKHAERPSPEIKDLLVKHNKMMKEESAVKRGGIKKTNAISNGRRISNVSAGTSAIDAVAESSKKGEKKVGFFGRKLSKT
ncbi:MAG: hypothetical protein Q9210_003145 [Variospora velana]